MQLATKRTAFLSSALVALAGFVFLAPTAQAGPLPEELLDHFTVYTFGPLATSGDVVTLTDQWRTETHVVGFLDRFALNTQKNNGPVIDPRAHLSWWSISGDGTDPVRPIVVTNQFGIYDLQVRQPRYLLAPAIKNPATEDEPLPDINHFKCYDAVGAPLGVGLALYTQFGVEFAVLADPAYFCNPVEKVHADGTISKVVDPTTHLTCYRIEPPKPGSGTVILRDQFIVWQGDLLEAELLCVPSLKENVVPNEERTWGGLKSIYR